MYKKDQPESIQQMFDSIAPGYDRANSLMSFSLHKKWNKTLWTEVVGSSHPSPLLDVCSGTGETTLPFLKNIHKPAEVYFLDFSKEMLSVAKKKAEEDLIYKHSFQYLVANAEEIPLLHETVRFIFLAYGIRNIKNPRQCLKECFRVLEKGGRFGILELTRPTNPLMRLGANIYMKGVLPLIGKFVSKNKQAYEYLSHSIQTFYDREIIVKMLEETGFSQVETKVLSKGLATIWIAEKK